MTKERMHFQVEGLEGLSNKATRFLRRHPEQARTAVVTALEVAALQYEPEGNDSIEEVPEALRPFVVRRSKEAELIGVSVAAERLKISRTTLYDWVAKRKLLAWKTTKRGLSIPAEQILGPGKVVPGLQQVLAVIEDPELAWLFLSQDWPFADEVVRPIDKLKAGKVAEVADAAPSFGTAVT
jgi:excisionase family DNA binding protein